MPQGGIPIGKVFGISLKLHYSWFIIFALITYSLTISYPTDWSLTIRIMLGLITSILFLISILLHELMHSVVAQREGIPVQSISLFILGGVSQMTKEPEKPFDEFRMALAGPFSSLVLGGIFYGLWYLFRDTNAYIAVVASWMGFINISLGIFNLIPGFPLDGGRVLRAVLWWLTNNLRRATKIASNIGRGVGYLFIFGGIFLIFTANWLQGVWIILIGWFLENAAVGSYRQLALTEVLKGHQAREIMTRDCLTVPAETTVETLINEHILTSGRRCFPIVDDWHVIGMVTIHNIKTVPQEQRNVRTVREIMTPFEKLKHVKPSEDLSSVMQVLTESDINQVPVVEGEDNIVGMVSRDNLLTFIDVRGGLGA